MLSNAYAWCLHWVYVILPGYCLKNCARSQMVTDMGNNITKMQGRWRRTHVCVDHWCAFIIHSIGWGIPSECALSLAPSSAAAKPRWPQRARRRLSALLETLPPQVGNKDVRAEGVFSFAPPFSNPHIVKHKGEHPEGFTITEYKTGRMIDKYT